MVETFKKKQKQLQTERWETEQPQLQASRRERGIFDVPK